MPDWRTPRLKRQMLSRNRLTEESPQVDLRSSNQKHGYSVRTVWPSPAPPETSCAVARPARAARRRKRAESHRSTNPNRRNRVRNRGACAPGRHGRTDELEKGTNRVALAEHPLREGRAGTAGAASRAGPLPRHR